MTIIHKRLMLAPSSLAASDEAIRTGLYPSSQMQHIGTVTGAEGRRA